MNKKALTLLLAAVVLFAYPSLQRELNDKAQLKALEDYGNLTAVAHGQELHEANNEPALSAPEPVLEHNSELTAEEPQPIQNPQPTTPAPLVTPISVAVPKDNAIGIIRIAKIGVNMPIFYGATEANMQRGAAQIEGTTLLGEIGNAALAGHRSRAYGRHFNRLGELAVGDTIEIMQGDKTLLYEIYKIHIVPPSDVSVLYRNSSLSILTLVTCDPIDTGTHRLIIHAVLSS